MTCLYAKCLPYYSIQLYSLVHRLTINKQVHLGWKKYISEYPSEDTHSDDLRVFSRSRIEPGAMGYGLAIALVRAWDGLGLVRENKPSLPLIPVDIW